MPDRYLGKTLGKYRVEELIGSGGFAWVYRGYDPTLEIPVALKVLKPQFAGDPTFEERFRREASTAARLRHPNIVKIYEVGRDGDAVYFAMDFLPSGLAARLETTPFLAEEFVIKVGMDVARALGFAHREGVIHRDIKVDNILFDVHGNAVVADFGIARAVSGYTQQTGTNMVVGTPQYFAPEQARAKPLDGRADIYSLGVSMYRASTGRLPFEGEDWYEIARAHVEDVPPSPRSLAPSISPAFERLLLRCLAKHPDDRPATGEQLSDELAEVQANPRALTHASGNSGMFLSPTETPTIRERAVIPGRRRRRKGAQRVALVVLGLVVLAAGALPLLARRNGQAAPIGEPPPLLPAGTFMMDQRLADSLRSDSTVDPIDAVIAGLQRADSSRATRPVTRLSVTATEGAQVTVNGVPVGTGTWSTDTLKAGTYQVRALLSAPEGCETASASRPVQLRAGTTQRVALDVRSCGTLSVSLGNDPLPAGARWQVQGGGIRREGALPLQGAIVLPAGLYELRITADRPCQDYQQEVQISAERPFSRRVRLLCEVTPDR
ncbi:MAG: serine/threonine protein kinase [Gemmatimonadaceae bacterium]|nr:serine/threonine protein kinase [Gemmatimonadaceae bacterium]